MFRKLNVNNETKGVVHLHSMPARYESWEDFTKWIEKVNVDAIVCLAPFDEIEVKSEEYAEAIRNKQLPCDKIDYPITDYGVPTDRHEFSEFVLSIAKRVQGGDSILVHCAGGIGRTGTVATCTLQQLGVENHEALKIVRKAGSCPENSDQKDLVDWHAENVCKIVCN